jgi:phage/plasmid-like protein (TIGR03299 family)
VVHNLNIENDRASMMYVRQVPWHGLGTCLPHPPETIAVAMKAANLDWEVGLKPVCCMEGSTYYEIPQKKAIVRLDKWGQPDCVPFGLVGNDYQVLQNRDAFSFFDLLAQTKKVTFETAGALGHGERVWVLAKVAGEMKIKGHDIVQKYLLLSTGHDGRTSVQVRFTPVRVVCQNTLIASLATGNDLFKIYHTPGLERAVTDAKQEVQNIFDKYAELEKLYERMAGKEIKDAELEKYLCIIFPDPKRKNKQSASSYEAALAKARAVRKVAAKLCKEGDGNDYEPIRNTLWTAYNGVVELVDHHWRYSDLWHRMESACFGENERVKQVALREAVKMLMTAV